ncbi:ATP-binding cassette domain-containing protein [Pannonibacter sp. Pt2-lr]
MSTPDREGAPGLKRVTLELKAGQITGLAGVSGNGQAALSDLVAGLASPDQGSLHVEGTVPLRWTPEAAVSAGIARIPEDRPRPAPLPTSA